MARRHPARGTISRERANSGPHRGSLLMLRWALIFFIVAIIAGLLGFTGIQGDLAYIARILFLIFLVVFLVSLVYALATGKKPPGV
jgi:uncharacterized membrane protein YtjA (UPF0391 family)